VIDHGFRPAARILHIGESMEKECLFCKIIRGEKPAEFLYRDESLVVFRDIYPGAPIYFLTNAVSILSRPLKTTSMSV
jgi:hypothetical protein